LLQPRDQPFQHCRVMSDDKNKTDPPFPTIMISPRFGWSLKSTTALDRLLQASNIDRMPDRRKPMIRND
jgi:hypothetical protein